MVGQRKVYGYGASKRRSGFSMKKGNSAGKQKIDRRKVKAVFVMQQR